MKERYLLEKRLIGELNEYFRLRGFPSTPLNKYFSISRNGINYTLLIDRNLFFFNETVVTANQIDIQKVDNTNMKKYNTWIMEHVLPIVNTFILKHQKENNKFIHLNRIRLITYIETNVILDKEYYFPNCDYRRVDNKLDSWHYWEEYY